MLIDIQRHILEIERKKSKLEEELRMYESVLELLRLEAENCKKTLS